MSKHHPYSRREFRRRLAIWLRRNVRLVAALTIGLVVTIAFITGLLLATWPDTAFKWWLLGSLQTGMVGRTFTRSIRGYLAHDADAIRHVRGAWGEDNTRSELQRAKRKNLVWGWVDMTRAAQKVRLRAEGVTRDLLKGTTRGARRAKVNPLSVTSVVALWGPAQHGVPDGASIEGIEFIAGRKLVDWLSRLDGQLVDRGAAADIVRSLEGRRTATEQAHAARTQRAIPPTS